MLYRAEMQGEELEEVDGGTVNCRDGGGEREERERLRASTLLHWRTA